MPRTEKYFVGPKLLDDIREVITRVNGQPDKTSGPHFNAVHQDIQRPLAAALRYVSWTAEWPATVTATFTFLPSAGQTATAKNTFAGVGPGEGWVARHQGTWHLAVVNLTMQASYSTATIQLLGHNGEEGGLLKWFSVTQCGTATAT